MQQPYVDTLTHRFAVPPLPKGDGYFPCNSAVSQQNPSPLPFGREGTAKRRVRWPNTLASF